MNPEMWFYYYLIGMISSSIGVISSFHPIASTIFLAFAFSNAFLILMAMGFEFIAFIFLIVYVGAIIILFLYTILLLHLKGEIFVQKINNIFLFKTIYSVASIQIVTFYFSYQLVFFDDFFYFKLYSSNIFLDIIDALRTSAGLQAYDSMALISINSSALMLKCQDFTPEMPNLKLCKAEDALQTFSTYKVLLVESREETLQGVNIHSFVKLGNNQFNQDLVLTSELHSLGLVLYDKGCVYLILASIILLIALIGSVVLITPENSEVTQSQYSVNQNTKYFSFFY
jgi:NADH:ubiquinone oxidoreductase subunit 6 (subunit J)